MPKVCGVCKVNETGRLINGVPVCSRCFLDGQYNLPENQAKLAKPKTESSGDYLCPECNVTHKAGSKIHKRHMKLLK